MQKKQSKPSSNDRFDLRITPSRQKQYNALNDPHANYYFVSSAAKQRLKDLKKEIRREKHKKSNEEKEMLKLIKEKIKFKFPKIKLPLVNQKEMQGLIKSSRQQYSYENVSIKMAEIDKNNISKDGRVLTDIKKSITSLNKRESLKNSINHTDFIQFLAEKKNMLKQEPQT